MIKFNNIDHINLTVSNLNRSSDFYKRVFDFEVFEEETRNGRRYQILGKSQKGMVCLYENLDKKLERKNFGESRFNHVGFNVEFTKNIVKELEKSGVQIVYFGESPIVEYPNSKSIYIRDPDGNEIELSDTFAGGL